MSSCLDEQIMIKEKDDRLISRVNIIEEERLILALEKLIINPTHNGRSLSVQDFELKTALKRVNPEREIINYSILVENNLPYSLTNLIVKESDNQIDAGFIKYIPDDITPHFNGWDWGHFIGKIELYDLNWTKRGEIRLIPSPNNEHSNGRSAYTICTTETWHIGYEDEEGFHETYVERNIHIVMSQ